MILVAFQDDETSHKKIGRAKTTCSLPLFHFSLVQGQVNRAEVEETTFAIKRELAAIRQHDMDTNHKLEEARERYVIFSVPNWPILPAA
jgi:hypothetical protein